MKNIECHYKDGSLIFCTKHGYTYPNAHRILDIFNINGLISTVREKPDHLFNVVGRLPVNYDPFSNHSKKWNYVVSELKRTKATLEEDIRGI
jgi:hypothetical protein